ncbi:MAG TPA: RsmG family class I SAM-dependent methyltransferase [Holophagaceae bacterium]|nr:RsmG family class I SAM-dependent methyltransferase [Holophagaceae bacterium]
MIPRLPPELEPALQAWLTLLDRWNRTHALTALPPEARWEELVQDPAALLPGLNQLPSGSIVADLGTGMGSPAVVLALARPDLRILGVDASAKKLAFLRQSALELGLRNLEAVHGRFESLPALGADLGVAKALAPLDQLAGWWARHARPGAPLLALKGPGWRAEAMPPGWRIEAGPYRLPTRGDRVLLTLTQA